MRYVQEALSHRVHLAFHQNLFDPGKKVVFCVTMYEASFPINREGGDSQCVRGHRPLLYLLCFQEVPGFTWETGTFKKRSRPPLTNSRGGTCTELTLSPWGPGGPSALLSSPCSPLKTAIQKQTNNRNQFPPRSRRAAAKSIHVLFEGI